MLFLSLDMPVHDWIVKPRGVEMYQYTLRTVFGGVPFLLLLLDRLDCLSSPKAFTPLLPGDLLQGDLTTCVRLAYRMLHMVGHASSQADQFVFSLRL